MYISKLSAPLQLALRYENLLSADTKSFFVTDEPNVWEVVVEHIGDLSEIAEAIGFTYEKLNNQFSILKIGKENIVKLSNYTNIVTISLPSPMIYNDIGLAQICASGIGGGNAAFNVTGKGVLLGVVDSGIDYRHEDFRNPDGTTRIMLLWDQTIEGEPSESGFNKGVVYTKEAINEALKEEDREASLALVPTQDDLGHGTAITGIAGGNGRGSANRNRGVAPQCEFIIVKTGQVGSQGRRPRDIDIMRGIRYVIDCAILLKQPISILLGIGNNVTGHDGTAPLERYIDQIYYRWISNVSVGTGNEGDRGRHYEGTVQEGAVNEIQLLIEGTLTNYACCIWKEFIDEIEVVITSPQGEQTEVLTTLTPLRAFVFDDTIVLVNFTEPTIDIERQQIWIWFQGQDNQTINTGIWKIQIKGTRILSGKFNVWGQSIADGENRTRFLNSTVNMSLTSPGTAKKLTTVGAFNGPTTQIAAFSGRGYTRTSSVKPEVVAPGVNVTVPSTSSNNAYTLFSGTSAAAAFVAGAYALLLEYGYIQLGVTTFYGESLKVFLLKNAKRPIVYGPYPNESWGYGILCIEAALNNMLEVYNSTSR